MKPVKAVLIGAGQRGMLSYATYAEEHPDEIQFVGVVEPNDAKRARFGQIHGITDEMSFKDWETFFSEPRDTDAVLVCTQDATHFHPTIKALEHGYHVLLEKPMSNDPEECFILGEYAKKYDRLFAICHVLRYTTFFATLKQLLEEGAIGRLLSVQLSENVGYWHQAHSYVRGNWRNSNESSPMILAKSSHDMDIMLWLAGADCLNVSSFGYLSHFTADNAPEGAPLHCLDGCPVQAECPYYAPKIYIDWKDSWQGSVIRSVVCREPDDEAILQALRKGPYGRCVYHCDNNVVDHQVVNLEFANEVTASFTMSAFTKDSSRTLKLMGTKGEIRGAMEKNEIEISLFGSSDVRTIHLDQSEHGHGGGDHGIMKGFVEQVRQHAVNGAESLTSAAKSVQSHLIAFAAEKSRVEKKTINLSEYMASFRK